MSLGILTNVAATYAENNLNKTQGSLQTVLQQLSSGSRINSGADDAAGLSVADGLHANEAALTQSAQNAQNGVGLLQTADGAHHDRPARKIAGGFPEDVTGHFVEGDDARLVGRSNFEHDRVALDEAVDGLDAAVEGEAVHRRPSQAGLYAL